MKNILLDTNVLSELMRPQPDQVVIDWFAKLGGVNFYVSAITQAEIFLGIALLPEGKRKDALEDVAKTMFREDFAGRCLPFDPRCAEHYARIVCGRRRSGLPMTTEDAQIAAIAKYHNYALATRNTKDFLHISGLNLCNPWSVE